MIKQKPVGMKLTQTQPLYTISFKCSNRAFYSVLKDVIGVGGAVGSEYPEEYITRSCDFDGDLEKLTIYGEEFKKAIMSFYGYNNEKYNMAYKLVLTCY